MNPLVAFYQGDCDDRGRSLDDVLRFDDAALERVHDFVQWLFPLRERSGANPDAPTLDDAAVESFRTGPELQEALRRSLDRMLTFYGLQRSGDAIVPAPGFSARRQWLTPGNHNHLRLTRMLISLRTLGLETEARALYRCLCDIAARCGGITAATRRYWDEAMRRTP
jgi:hypothetical protein